MEEQQILKDFFCKGKEFLLNDELVENPGSFNKKEAIDYIDILCDIPMVSFIHYLTENIAPVFIRSTDITQSSRIEACHIEICKAFIKVNNRGITLSEVGKLLQDDGVKRSANTINRYGLDQTKTARQLGLVRNIGNKWYLTCYGIVFLDLDESKRIALMARLLMRDPLYSQITRDALNEDVKITKYMFDLSDKTINRRKGSVLKLCNMIVSECQKNSSLELHLITF